MSSIGNNPVRWDPNIAKSKSQSEKEILFLWICELKSFQLFLLNKLSTHLCDKVMTVKMLWRNSWYNKYCIYFISIIKGNFIKFSNIYNVFIKKLSIFIPEIATKICSTFAKSKEYSMNDMKHKFFQFYAN